MASIAQVLANFKLVHGMSGQLLPLSFSGVEPKCLCAHMAQNGHALSIGRLGFDKRDSQFFAEAVQAATFKTSSLTSLPERIGVSFSRVVRAALRFDKVALIPIHKRKGSSQIRVNRNAVRSTDLLHLEIQPAVFADMMPAEVVQIATPQAAVQRKFKHQPRLRAKRPMVSELSDVAGLPRVETTLALLHRVRLAHDTNVETFLLRAPDPNSGQDFAQFGSCGRTIHLLPNDRIHVQRCNKFRSLKAVCIRKFG
ncbi:hypothetical protein L6Q21_13115 [Sandaracinobacter sp. RS1-74]|nr:hypothetical protein [Sandaracinobacteroides sayramensis]MCG2841923.1 hypothetical protein [Sandaracinobacteroides sayramensis]